MQKKRLTMKKVTADRTVEEVFEDFIKISKVKNLSDQTIIYYQNAFHILTKFISKETLIKDVDQDLIHDYILKLKESMKTT